MIKEQYLYQPFKNIYGAEFIAKYCFESELVDIPDTDMYLEVDPGNWVVYTNDLISLYLVSHEDFIINYVPDNKFASNYLEFVIDSINSDYTPVINILDESLLETAEEFIEKEISLTLKERIRLIWDLILGKKVNISRY